MTMKQRASERIWNIISNPASSVSVKVSRPGQKEYSSKEYVSPIERKASKESGGILNQHSDTSLSRLRQQE